MYQTVTNSDLFFRIYKVYSNNEKHYRCKVLYFYKSSGYICTWLNPRCVPKTFNLVPGANKRFIEYNTEIL